MTAGGDALRALHDEPTSATHAGQQAARLSSKVPLSHVECEKVAPAKWKMAIITSIVIYPLLFIIPALLALVIGDAPKWFASLLNVAVTIPLMTWILMPAVTKLLAGWLHQDDLDPDPPRG